MFNFIKALTPKFSQLCVDIEKVARQLIRLWMNASDSMWLCSEAACGGLKAYPYVTSVRRS